PMVCASPTQTVREWAGVGAVGRLFIVAGRHADESSVGRDRVVPMTGPLERDSAGFAETWAAFCARECTLGRSDDAIDSWRRGRVRYLVWALRLDDPWVLRRMTVVSHRLGDSILPVPSRDAHITVWVCGFLARTPKLDDDVAEAVVAAQCAAAREVR